MNEMKSPILNRWISPWLDRFYFCSEFCQLSQMESTWSIANKTFFVSYLHRLIFLFPQIKVLTTLVVSLRFLSRGAKTPFWSVSKNRVEGLVLNEFHKKPISGIDLCMSKERILKAFFVNKNLKAPSSLNKFYCSWSFFRRYSYEWNPKGLFNKSY